MRTTIAVLTALALCGCATTFYGEPKVKGGPRGCWDWCRAQGMELAGMVKMGEYSDGCICQVPPASAPAAAPPAGPRSESASPPGADGPAVAGVWSQMQAAAAQQMNAAAAAAAHQSSAHRHSSSRYGGYGGPGRF
jgi:hypothetical protein